MSVSLSVCMFVYIYICVYVKMRVELEHSAHVVKHVRLYWHRNPGSLNVKKVSQTDRMVLGGS